MLKLDHMDQNLRDRIMSSLTYNKISNLSKTMSTHTYVFIKRQNKNIYNKTYKDNDYRHLCLH